MEPSALRHEETPPSRSRRCGPHHQSLRGEQVDGPQPGYEHIGEWRHGAPEHISRPACAYISPGGEEGAAMTMDEPDHQPDTAPSDHASPADEPFTLAEKLDRLFATTHPADRGPYTLREVADLVTQQELRKHRPGDPPPVKISFSYLSQLRTGTKANPSFKQLAALAEFFEVPVTYFTGSAPEVDRIDAELALSAAMRDTGIRDLALRA